MNLPDTSHLTAELEAAFKQFEAGKMKHEKYAEIRARIWKQIKQSHEG